MSSAPGISVLDRERTNLIPDVSLNRAFGEAPLRVLGRKNWKELDEQVQRSGIKIGERRELIW